MPPTTKAAAHRTHSLLKPTARNDAAVACAQRSPRWALAPAAAIVLSSAAAPDSAPLDATAPLKQVALLEPTEALMAQCACTLESLVGAGAGGLDGPLLCRRHGVVNNVLAHLQAGHMMHMKCCHGLRDVRDIRPNCRRLKPAEQHDTVHCRRYSA
jgi:hypothetical protein